MCLNAALQSLGVETCQHPPSLSMLKHYFYHNNILLIYIYIGKLVTFLHPAFKLNLVFKKPFRWFPTYLEPPATNIMLALSKILKRTRNPDSPFIFTSYLFIQYDILLKCKNTSLIYLCFLETLILCSLYNYLLRNLHSHSRPSNCKASADGARMERRISC